MNENRINEQEVRELTEGEAEKVAGGGKNGMQTKADKLREYHNRASKPRNSRDRKPDDGSVSGSGSW